LFDPTNPLALLKVAVQGVNINTITVLTLDTALATGGIQTSIRGQTGERHANAGGVLNRGTGRLDPQRNPQFMCDKRSACCWISSRSGLPRGAHPLAYVDQHDETGGAADELTRRASVQPSS
jgi:hypothetical protein